MYVVYVLLALVAFSVLMGLAVGAARAQEPVVQTVTTSGSGLAWWQQDPGQVARVSEGSSALGWFGLETVVAAVSRPSMSVWQGGAPAGRYDLLTGQGTSAQRNLDRSEGSWTADATVAVDGVAYQILLDSASVMLLQRNGVWTAVQGTATAATVVPTLVRTAGVVLVAESQTVQSIGDDYKGWTVGTLSETQTAMRKTAIRMLPGSSITYSTGAPSSKASGPSYVVFARSDAGESVCARVVMGDRSQDIPCNWATRVTLGGRVGAGTQQWMLQALADVQVRLHGWQSWSASGTAVTMVDLEEDLEVRLSGTRWSLRLGSKTILTVNNASSLTLGGFGDLIMAHDSPWADDRVVGSVQRADLADGVWAVDLAAGQGDLTLGSVAQIGSSQFIDSDAVEGPRDPLYSHDGGFLGDWLWSKDPRYVAYWMILASVVVVVLAPWPIASAAMAIGILTVAVYQGHIDAEVAGGLGTVVALITSMEVFE